MDNDGNDSSYDNNMNFDKAQIRVRIGKVSFLHKALIRKLSNEFAIQYKKLNLRKHPEF